MNNPLNLYPHNLEGYFATKQAFEEGRQIVSNVRATGTGKSFINLQLILDYSEKKVIYVVPSLSIIEHLQEIIDENPNVDMNSFSHVDFRTFQSFINMSLDELKNLECDLLIVDEFHHLNGPVWENRISSIIETHPKIKVFGTTAYTVVNRGTSYERDMALDGGDEIFSNSVVNRYDICDAILDGVLPKPIYKSAYINLTNELGLIEKNLDSASLTLGEYQKYQLILADLKRRIHESPTVAELLKKYLKPNGKYYYFCPNQSQNGVNDIETIKAQTMRYLKGKYREEDIVFYTTTSEMGELGKKNRDAFYHDKTLDGVDCSNKLRIMFAINQYNEGVHAPNVDGVIEGRMTNSDIVYFEHLGRGLAVRGDTTKRYEELENYSLEEIAQMCQDRAISIKECSSKEELIEKLLAPIIIDLTGNYDFIRELENNLKDRLKNRNEDSIRNYQKRKITDVSFDIEVENIDLFDTLMELKKNLSSSWTRMYEYACCYYEYHGNLEVSNKFRTNNGYEYNENGKIHLGRWLENQRKIVSPESEHGQLLLKIGMRFSRKKSTLSWEEMYGYACLYYKHHGNLEVLRRFKTNNGYEYDENGKINLGTWISNQRKKVSPESERGQLLLKIGIDFANKKSALSFKEMYRYAYLYYKYHGNLEVPAKFKTNNGYEYDENGKINLGIWITNQRSNVLPESERGQLLLKIGMRFSHIKLNFNEMYAYAQIYYEHYGNLEIPSKFKTNNGYEYDENGKINLGTWIVSQRNNVSLESKKGQLLLKIGMRFSSKRNILSFKEMYEYARIYYEHYGNLEIPARFRTSNGYEYDENGKVNLGAWIFGQRSTVSPKSERGQLLLKIGMRFSNKRNRLSFKEMYEYARIYYEYHGNLEVPAKFRTSNGYEYDENGKVNLGMWIAKQRERVPLESERGQLLLRIGMRFAPLKIDWEEMYQYACLYYEYHGNLEVPAKFKTNNGYEYDENGRINLGGWIVNQRFRMSSENKQGQLLLKIGMRFDSKRNLSNFKEMYEYARIYYEYHGNLEVPVKFKTNNGYEYDENGKISLGIWITTQKQFYQKKEMSEEQIVLLEDIGMKWMSEKVDGRLQREKIIEKNTRKKQIELLNRTKSLLNHIHYEDFEDKRDVEKINEQFMDELNHRSR